MRHFAPLALAACLGTTAVSASLPAAAGVVVSVGPVPGVVVAVPPRVAPWPYYYGPAPRVFYPGYVGYGWGVGYRYGVPYGGYHFGYRAGFAPGGAHLAAHGYVHGGGRR